jgi:vitamin B12 transporter
MKLFLLSAIQSAISRVSSILSHIALAGCVLLFGLRLQAQTADGTHKQSADTSRQLQEVAIHSAQISLRNISASPVQVLKGADLEKLNSLSVADAIRFFSGVQIKDYGGVGGLKTINVRSLGSNHVGVFYDGVEFGNSQNGQVDLGKFSLDNIAEIDLYNVQQNTIFQPARGFASGSSIYLITRRAEFDPASRSDGKVSLKAGSFGLINPSLFWQYKLSDNIYSTISTEITHANGRYKFRSSDGGYDTTAVRQNADISAQRVEAGLNGKLKDSSAWNVKGYLYNSDRGLPAAVVRHKFVSTQREWDRNKFVQASFTKTFGSNYSVMLNAKYTDDFTRYLDPERTIVVNGVSGFADDRYYEHEFYFSFANRYRITSFWDISLAADYERNTLRASQNDSSQYRFVNPVRNQLLTVLATDLHFGRLSAQASLLGTFVNDTVDTLTAAGRKQEYTPAILVSWQPAANPDLRLRASYKDIFRLPTFNDLYFTFIGNTYLKPEFAKQADLGITYNKSFQNQALIYFAVQTDAYYNQVTNKIVAIPGQNLARWTMYNLGNVHIRGLEVNAQARWLLPPGIVLNTSLSYTYQKAADVTNSADPYNGQIPYSPVNSGSFLLGADWHKFSFNYCYLYTGERYDEVDNIPANYVRPWYTHDAGFSYTTEYRNNKIKFSAEINNLFNQSYDVILNFPMPGRNFRFTISTTF